MSIFRKRLFASMLILIPLGFATKLYWGPGREWVHNYAGGIVYVMFWALVLAALVPRLRPSVTALSVFTATTALEFLQLWHPPFLEKIRSTFIGRVLIGATFSFYDIIYYAAGMFIVYVFLCRTVRTLPDTE